MHRRPRGLTVAHGLLALMVVLSSLALAAPRGTRAQDQDDEGVGPSAREAIATKFENGQLDYATALLYRGYAIFEPERLPVDLAGMRVMEEDRAFFLEARENWAALPTAVQEELTPYLVRPTDSRSIHFDAAGETGMQTEAGDASCPNGWTSRVSERFDFKVWAHCTGDFEEDLATAITVIEDFWEAEVALMGPPIPDAGTPEAGGDSRIDFYFVEDEQDQAPRPSASTIGEWALAHATPDEPFVGRTSSGHVIARRENIGEPSDTLTMAHEFFHVLQDAHNYAISFGFAREPAGQFDVIRYAEYWFTEATATWVMSYLYRDELPGAVASAVHRRFIEHFQGVDAPLHFSPRQGGRYFDRIYAAYVYFLFMEQELGPEAIARFYDDLRVLEEDDEEGATALLDSYLPFETHFREFAVRNLNLDLKPGDPISPSYKDLDPSFPEGIRPPLAVGEGADRALAAGERREIPAIVRSLTAQYYQLIPDAGVAGLTFDFTGLTPGEAVDVDLIVKIKDGNWERRQLPVDAATALCFSNPADHVETFYLVVSNHDLDIDTTVSGSFTVSDAGC